MTRHCMFGPDVTFLGIDRCDLADLSTYAEADVVVLGAPFDSGTSYRPGARFGPMAIRSTDYLPHDGSRPHLALGVDPLQDMRVVDAGDIEMPPTETELSPGTGTPEPGGLTSRQLLDAPPGWRCGSRSSAWMSSRSRPPTTARTSLPCWLTGSCWKRCQASRPEGRLE